MTTTTLASPSAATASMQKLTAGMRHFPAMDVDGPAQGDSRLWSVTTVIDILDKPGIPYWAAEEAAWCAIRNERTWKAMLADDGEPAAVKYLRDARMRRSKDRLSDSEFGTAIHDLCERYVLTGTPQAATRERFHDDYDAARQCMDQFDAWIQRAQPNYLATEMTVFSPTYGIAGTSDGIFELSDELTDRLRLDGPVNIFDYKSSKKSYDKRGEPTTLYPEIGMQLAGYRYAEFTSVWHARRFNDQWRRRFYLISDEEREQAVPVPVVDGGIGIKITPEHCTAYPIRCDEEVYSYFLHCLEMARWKYEDSKTIIGKPLSI